MKPTQHEIEHMKKEHLPYGLVTIDLDDTLLGDDLMISAENREAIKACIDLGVVVTIATGRMYLSAKKFAEQLGLDVPIITYQGAYVKTLFSEEVLYRKFVPKNITKQAIEIARANSIHVHCYFNDMIYSEDDNEYMKQYSKLADVPYEVVDDLLAIDEESIKVLFVDTPERLDEFALTLGKAFGDQVHLTKSKAHYLELTHPQATKGQAVTFLADKLGIPIEKVMAFGDSFNDKDMLETAGMGIAMGNGHPEIKKIADYVTKSNNEHGIHEALHKFILDKL